MTPEKWSFDRESAKWDHNPIRVRLANDIFKAVSEEGILEPDMDILDFGCGTGLLTVQLAAVVRSVTGVDNSQGMLDVLKTKIGDGNLTNVKAQYLDLEKGDVLEGSYDLILSSMTLHHVREMEQLLNRFHEVTAPGGLLCIADLDPEEGRFHGENDTVFHHGFDRAMLHRLLAEAGFEQIRDRTAAKVEKPASDGTVQSFDVFLMTGRKKP